MMKNRQCNGIGLQEHQQIVGKGQEMKALEILKAQKAEIEKMDIGSLKTKLLQETIKDLVEINEAIAELEAIQQSKSCDGCKHYKFTYNSNDGAVRQLMTICSDCFRRLNRDNYETKEQ